MNVKVEIVADGRAIGVADLRPADSSMAVASGIFHPANDYDPALHARVTEQKEPAETPASLRARTLEGTYLNCAGIDLTDFAATLGDEGREVHLLGVDGFGSLFAEGSYACA
jgi:hypothetical protein